MSSNSETFNASETHQSPNIMNSSATEIKPDLAEFYRNKCIFITGGSGFVGKSLIYKILRDCPDVECLYILMRPKRDLQPEQRLTQLVKSWVFNNLRADIGEAGITKKLRLVEGDMNIPGLGISEASRTEICKRVHIVFHVAATVKFNEPLKVAVIMNTRGTREILSLAKDMINLQAFVHTSTLFSNSLGHEILEEVYPTKLDPECLVQCAEWMDEKLMDSLTPQLVGKRPNTYVYTKHLAEKFVYDASKTIPAAIFRPSIVMSTLREPEPGWVENMNGPAGIAASGGLCMLGSTICHREKNAEICPVDGCANILLAIAWYLANFKPEDCPVYNYSATKGDGPHWQVFEDQFHILYRKLPFSSALGTPIFSLTHYFLKMNIVQGYFLLYAYVMDFILGLAGQKKRLVRVQQRVTEAARSLEHFTVHEWTAHTKNVYGLLNLLSPKDAVTFNFSLKDVDWNDYVYQFTHGVRKHVLKEDDSTAPAAGRRIQRLWLIHASILVLFIGFLTHFIMSKVFNTSVTTYLQI